MDWHWIVGISITLGLATVGGIWALVQLVAKLVGEATAVKIRLDLVVPIAQEMPAVKQGLAVHEHRITDHDDDIGKLQEMASELASVRMSRKH